MSVRFTPVLIVGVAALVYLGVYMITSLNEFGAKFSALFLFGATVPAIIILLILALEQAMVDHANPSIDKLLVVELIFLSLIGSGVWLFTRLPGVVVAIG